MKTHYLSALTVELLKKKKERGAVVAIRTRDLCGVDKRCSFTLRAVMLELVARGLAVRHKQGVYLIPRQRINDALLAIREILNAI